MLSHTRILPKTSKKILSGSSRQGLFSHDSKPHPLLAPFLFRGRGFDFFLSADVFSGDSFSAHFLNLKKIQAQSEISIESGFLSLLPD